MNRRSEQDEGEKNSYGVNFISGYGSYLENLIISITHTGDFSKQNSVQSSFRRNKPQKKVIREAKNPDTHGLDLSKDHKNVSHVKIKKKLNPTHAPDIFLIFYW